MKQVMLFSMLVVCGALQADVVAAQALPQRVYTYAIDLDSEGKVARLSPHGFAVDATSRRLDTQIGGWIFEAAPSATTTYLRVVVAPHAGGEFDVVSAITGPAPQTLAQPGYPIRDQLAGMEGTVVLKLAIGVDGHVNAVDVHDVVGDVSRAMTNAAATSAKTWTFSPETVNGKAVASTVLWPVCYLGAASSASACAWRGPDAQHLSSKTVLTLNPAARLVTPLAFESR